MPPLGGHPSTRRGAQPLAPKKKTARKLVGPYDDVLRPGGRSEVPVDQQLEHVKRNYFDPQNPAKPDQQKVVVQRLQTWATKNPKNAAAAAFAKPATLDRPRVAPAPEKPNRDKKVTHIAAMGIPIAQATPDLVKLLEKLDPGERTNVIAGFPNEGRIISGDKRWADALRKAADEKGNELGTNPTDKELLSAALGPSQKKTIGGLAANFAKGAILSPVGAFAGGMAVGQAARSAIGGDFAPAKEIAAQQVDFLKGAKDPDKLYADPFGYTLGAYAAVRGGARIGGAAARGGVLGASAKAFADQGGTERLILPPSTRGKGKRAVDTIVNPDGSVPETPRVLVGRYSDNPLDLVAQRAHDKLRERGIGADKAIKKSVRRQIGLSDALSKKAETDLTKPVYRSLAVLSRAEQRAVIFAHYGRGSKPSEMVSFYQRAVDAHRTPDNEQALAVWKSIDSKVGDKITGRMQTALDEMRAAGVKADDVAREIKDPMGRRTFTDPSLERGRGIEAAIVRAQHGDEHAQAVLDMEAQVRNLRKDAEDARTSTVPRKAGDAIKVEQARLQAGRDVEIRALKKRLARAEKLKKAPPGKRPVRGLGPAAITQIRNRIALLEAVPPKNAKITSLEKRRADHPDPDALEGQAHQAEIEAGQAMRDFLASRGDDQPGYVVSKVVDPDRPTRGITKAGRASLSGDPKPKLGGATKRNEGALLRTGKANVSPEAYLGGLARNTRVRNVLDIGERLAAQNAVREANGMKYDANIWVARRLDEPKHETGRLEREAHSITEKTRALDEMEPTRRGIKETSAWEDAPEIGPDGRATVPHDGEWMLMRKTARDELDGRMRVQDAALQKALNGTRAWRWMTLNARPAWLVANLVGNTAMAGLYGTGAVSTARAISGKYGSEGADVIPDQLKGGGIFSSVLNPSAGLTNTKGVGGWGIADTMLGKAEPMSLGITRAAIQGTRRTGEEIRTGNIPDKVGTLASSPLRVIRFAGNLAAEVNVKHENMLRDATYLAKAVPEAKRKVHGYVGRWFHGVNADVMAELKNMKSAEEVAPRIAQHVADALGELHGKVPHSELLTVVAPFWRWIAFISKQTLLTMPAKHPARALLLHQLGQLGLSTSEQMGMLNPAYQGGIPVGQDSEGRERIQPTGALNVWATPSQLVGGAAGNFSGLAGSINPLAGLAMEATTGRDPEGNVAENKYGEAIVPQPDPTIASSPDSLGDRLSLIGNRLSTFIPAGSLINPAFGKSDTGETRLGGRPSVYSEPSLGERLFGYGLGYKPRGIDLKENQRRKIASTARSLAEAQGNRNAEKNLKKNLERNKKR